MLEKSQIFFSFVYDDLMILQIIAASVSLLAAFESVERNAGSVRRVLFHFVLLFGCATLFNYVFFCATYFLPLFSGVNFPLAWLVTITFYLSLFNKDNLTGRIVTGATLGTTVIAMADLGRQLMGICSNYVSEDRSKFIVIAAYVLIVVFGLVLRKWSLRNYLEISYKTVALTLGNALVGILIVFIKTAMQTIAYDRADVFYAVVLGGIYLYSLMGYLMIYDHCVVNRENNMLLVENKLLEADKQMLQISDQARVDLRHLRHDMKNQYTLMQIMLEEKRYEELHEYFASMTGSKKDGNALSIAYIHCGNGLIDSIINMEITKAQTSGVRLVPIVDVPGTVPFERSSLCRILANLIDNAIEAEGKVESREKVITCKVMTVNDYLYIGVINDIPEDTDMEKLETLTTTKEDAANHGIGHRIVQRIVESYGGYINYSVDDGQFVAEAMLDMKYD